LASSFPPIEIHHLNCATLCPTGARLINGKGGLLAPGRLVCHCLLIEAQDTLVLIDTGFGTDDVANPRRLGQPFRSAVRPVCDPAETAVNRIRDLGLDPLDVGHVVLTHLDLDHAGGIADFPHAEIHVFADELATTESRLSLRERGRQVRAQWAHGPQWTSHRGNGDDWFGFESVSLLPGLDREIAMVPLAGHSAGHSGVAINRGDGWLLHCGDAYFHHGEVASPHSCPAGLRIFQNIVGHDRRRRLENQERLRELARSHGSEVELICSHDPIYLDA
jgi:glyoxylase-like metal-dependent hydrolase (beta-lactamase superfamily II)